MLDFSFKHEQVNLVDKLSLRLSRTVICHPVQQPTCFKIILLSYRAHFQDEGSLESQFGFPNSIAATLPLSGSIKSIQRTLILQSSPFRYFIVRLDMPVSC